MDYKLCIIQLYSQIYSRINYIGTKLDKALSLISKFSAGKIEAEIADAFKSAIPEFLQTSEAKK